MKLLYPSILTRLRRLLQYNTHLSSRSRGQPPPGRTNRGSEHLVCYSTAVRHTNLKIRAAPPCFDSRLCRFSVPSESCFDAESGVDVGLVRCFTIAWADPNRSRVEGSIAALSTRGDAQTTCSNSSLVCCCVAF